MDERLLAEFLDTHVPLKDVLSRLGMAALLGAGLGLDRELRGKPAGLRTHMLVAIAAATFTVMSFELVQELASMPQEIVRADPTRVIEAVVAGVGFLGAGSIIQARGSVKGLTTGAAMWLAGALGLACGAGSFGIALPAFVLGLLVLFVLGMLERHHAEER